MHRISRRGPAAAFTCPPSIRAGVAVEIDELELAGDAVGVAVGHGRQSGWRHVDRLVGVVAHEPAHRLTGSD
jgi:hypothetical protein